MTLFGPNLRPNLVKMTLEYFFRFFRALNMKNDGSYDKISLIFIPKRAERGPNFGQNDLKPVLSIFRPKAIKNDGSYDKIRQNLKKWIFGLFWDR